MLASSSRYPQQSPGRRVSRDSHRAPARPRCQQQALPPTCKARRLARAQLQSRSSPAVAEVPGAPGSPTVPPRPSPATAAPTSCRCCPVPPAQTPAEHPSPTFTKMQLVWWVVQIGRTAGGGRSLCPPHLPHPPCLLEKLVGMTVQQGVGRSLPRCEASYRLQRRRRSRPGPPLLRGLRLAEPAGYSHHQGHLLLFLQLLALNQLLLLSGLQLFLVLPCLPHLYPLASHV